MPIDRSEWDQFVELASSAAKSAGNVLRSGSFSVARESAHDVKSAADLRSHELLVSELGRTGIPVISEEDAGSWGMLGESGLRWIVDPLDGTVNYVLSNPLCCVSVALWDGDVPVLGVVHDFVRNELLVGGPGFGATCDSLSIEVSDTRERRNAVIGTGFPSGRSHDEAELLKFANSVGAYRKVRLLGSAALSLGWVARGWLDAYREDGIYFWDVAAGLAIVLGAGGAARWSPLNSDVTRLNVLAAGSSDLLIEAQEG